MQKRLYLRLRDFSDCRDLLDYIVKKRIKLVNHHLFHQLDTFHAFSYFLICSVICVRWWVSLVFRFLPSSAVDNDFAKRSFYSRWNISVMKIQKLEILVYLNVIIRKKKKLKHTVADKRHLLRFRSSSLKVK